jgi:hypothetical protein
VEAGFPRPAIRDSIWEMATVLKTIYLLIPIGLILFASISYDKFKQTFHILESKQGPNGLLIIQNPDGPLIGEKFVDWVDSVMPDRSQEVNQRVVGVARDLDKFAYFIQNHWVWIGLSVIFLLGLLIIMRAKDYSVK